MREWVSACVCARVCECVCVFVCGGRVYLCASARVHERACVRACSRSPLSLKDPLGCSASILRYTRAPSACGCRKRQLRDSALRSVHIRAGTRPTSAPGLGPHPRRDSAHIRAGTRPTSAPGLTRLSGSDRISGVFTYLRAGGAVGTHAPINSEIRVQIDTCA